MKARFYSMQPIRLSARHERWVHGVFGILILSGLWWLYARNFLIRVGEFGEERHPAEAWCLKAHGAAAMAFLMVLGTLWSGHIRRAWHLRRNRVSGLPLLLLMALLILTGYGLYYAGSEELRPWISLVHWLIGCLASLGLLLHVVIGKRRHVSLAAQLRADQDEAEAGSGRA